MRSFKGFSGGLFLTYGKDPLRIIDRRFPGQPTFEVVDHQLVGDLFAAYAPWKWFSVGLNLPVVLYSGGASGFQNAPEAAGFGIGDVRLSAKFLIIHRRDEGFGLAIEPNVSIPNATADTYAGDEGITATARLIADYKFDDTTFVANAGYRYRGTQNIGPYELGSDLQFGLGVRQGFMGDRLRLIGELLAGSSQEDCIPDPNDPNDTCPVCADVDERGCIPAPGALSRPFDGDYAIWFGNPAQGNYLGQPGSCSAGSGGNGSSVSGAITSPEIGVLGDADNIRVGFWYWYEIEGVYPNVNFDKMTILVSTNGTNFQEIGSLNPSVDTDGGADEAYTSAGFLQVPSWNKADIALSDDIVNAAKLSGAIWIRFNFDSGDGSYNAFRGWMVDNISLRGDGC